MAGSEAAENYQTINRSGNERGEKAMGLDYLLVNSEKTKVVPIIYGIKHSGGFYLKVVSNYKKLPCVEYLNFLEKENYRVIIVDFERMYFSGVIEISTIKKWHPKMEPSATNRNRMQFHGKFSEIVLLPPDEKRGFEASLITQLTNLFQ